MEYFFLSYNSSRVDIMRYCPGIQRATKISRHMFYKNEMGYWNSDECNVIQSLCRLYSTLDITKVIEHGLMFIQMQGFLRQSQTDFYIQINKDILKIDLGRDKEGVVTLGNFSFVGGRSRCIRTLGAV